MSGPPQPQEVSAATTPVEPAMRPQRDLWTLVAFILGVTAAGALVGITTAASIDTWYRTLPLPSWTPPDAAFGPVWTTLYVLLGIAGWQLWRVGGRTLKDNGPLGWWMVHIFLNLAWTPIFFGLRAPTAALVDIVLLDAAAITTTVKALAADRVAALLHIPYLLWLGVATALNLAIVLALA